MEGQREAELKASEKEESKVSEKADSCICISGAGWDHHRGNGCRKNGNVCR